MNTIEVHNIGPVEDFTYALEQTGLHVLRGNHGAGKTTILRTIQLATDGRTDVKPTKRDGAKRGEASIAGKNLRITTQVRQEGDLSVEGLGDLDIASLHTPKFVDVATRDKHRIKVLARLAGAAAEPSLFYDLVGGKDFFDDVVGTEAVQTDDLVEMAAKVKAALERKAREHEQHRDTAKAHAAAKHEQTDGVDMDAPHDEGALQAAYDAAVEQRSAVKAKRASATEVIERAESARKKLDGMKLPKLDELQANIETAQQAESEARQKVESLRKQLDDAERMLHDAESKRAYAYKELESAKETNDLYEQWSTDIAAAEGVDCPTQDDIEAADDDVRVASQAVDMGRKVRAALAAEAEAAAYREKVRESESSARRLRDAAKDTQEVLSEAIARLDNCPLRVRIDDNGNPRVVLETDRSDTEPFDELSDGERWPYIIRIAAAKNRVIVLPQAAFGELNNATRQQLHDLAIEHDCYILTAQVDEGDLRAELWNKGDK